MPGLGEEILGQVTAESKGGKDSAFSLSLGPPLRQFYNPTYAILVAGETWRVDWFQTNQKWANSCKLWQKHTVIKTEYTFVTQKGNVLFPLCVERQRGDVGRERGVEPGSGQEEAGRRRGRVVVVVNHLNRHDKQVHTVILPKKQTEIWSRIKGKLTVKPRS